MENSHSDHRVQAVPADEGKAGTQRTEVRFAYDDEAVYVGARMFDSLGAKGVVTRLGFSRPKSPTRSGEGPQERVRANPLATDSFPPP